MKKSMTKHDEQVQENNIEDDMILSSDFMTKKDKNEKQ